ncbi:MAG: glycerophosphodiester phosphodiesterase family protein [Promethearchaeota archaeon]|nr:MAG: glycerophosphodiester phosphodiesterase family protein [Candidatus Lokiarchaeota archaeon]
MKEDFLFIGHRGCRTEFIDENTVNAFQMALEYGANYIEFDVRKTKDGSLIIIHDQTLERTTQGSGSIKNLLYSEIINFKTEKTRQKIPLLPEVLEKFKGKIKFMIELKDRNIQGMVLDLVERKNLVNDCIFSGRYLSDLYLLRELKSNIKICYNITKGHEFNLEKFFTSKDQHEMLFHNIDMISLRSDLITEDFLNICHKNNALALSWDFYKYDNSIYIIKELIRKGIGGILFDNYKNIPVIQDWLKR